MQRANESCLESLAIQARGIQIKKLKGANEQDEKRDTYDTDRRIPGIQVLAWLGVSREVGSTHWTKNHDTYLAGEAVAALQGS